MTKCKDAALIFLGDYGDRGVYSTEVYYTILTLKLAFLEQVVPYFNAFSAYLNLPLYDKCQNAQQMVPWIHVLQKTKKVLKKMFKYKHRTEKVNVYIFRCFFHISD
jgi:hypothetical protein